MRWTPTKVAKEYRLKPEIYPQELEVATEVATILSSGTEPPDSIVIDNRGEYLIKLVYGKSVRDFDYLLYVAPRSASKPYHGIVIPDDRTVYDIYDDDVEAIVDLLTDGRGFGIDKSALDAANKDAVDITQKVLDKYESLTEGLDFNPTYFRGLRTIEIYEDLESGAKRLGSLQPYLRVYDLMDEIGKVIEEFDLTKYDWKSLIKDTVRNI